MTPKKHAPKPQQTQLLENEELRARLDEAEETLRAIREGEVDAVIVSGSRGEQVFSLAGADSIYRLIAETMYEAALTTSFDGRVLFCNQQFGRLLDLPMEKIIGRELESFVSEAHRGSLSSLLQQASACSSKARIVLIARGGTKVPVHISASLLQDPNGPSICVVVLDLTELENSTELIQQLRRQQESLRAANEELSATEEELRVQNEEIAGSRAELDQMRARYQDLFETAPDGYIGTDGEGIIQEVNQAAVRMFGRSPVELKGNPFSALVPMSQREDYLRLLGCINAGEFPLPDWEFELRASEGQPFWGLVSAAASRDVAGRVIGLRWLIHDITDRRRAEDAVRRSNADLEDKVRERTAELAQRARQLRALATELTLSEQRERRRIAAVLHDHLQQLLVGAKFHTSILGRHADPSLAREVLEIDKLLDEAINASRSLTAELSPPILHEGGLVAGLEWLSRWMADKHGLTVDLAAEKERLPLAEDEKILLFESVRELLFNAAKHARVKSAGVLVRRVEEKELHIIVTDAGPGFDTTKLKSVGGDGGGFGLFSIRERLDLIGGRLDIESTPGKGSRFILTMPLGRAENTKPSDSPDPDLSRG